jgi:hypothetical protein
VVAAVAEWHLEAHLDQVVVVLAGLFTTQNIL